ncbi:MAG: DMT family transporter [Rhodospirillaceae bacterium]|nr:DMT family transporter [Rhodospirillaceae bacterium]
MRRQEPMVGISLAFVCLGILGAMPVIANSRPAGFGALSFAFFLSVWQLICAVPLVAGEALSGRRGILDPALAPKVRRRTVAIILVTGMIFGLSTYAYVLAVERAGAVAAAIGIQAYPLFAITWETVFLKRRKSPAELGFTLVLLAALYYLATGGTWAITGFSAWFAVALGVPFLWSIAHVIVREVLVATPITPGQVTFLRVLISSLFLGAVLLAVAGPEAVLADLADAGFQRHAFIMGLVYYLELIMWFYAMRHIDVSVASSIAVPSPVLTMVLAIVFLGDRVEPYQVAALAVVIASLYGLLLAGLRKRRRQHT